MPIARIHLIHWLPDQYYHLYNRGARKVTIFRDGVNYLFALSRIKKYLREFDLAMIAYCLLPNHYHLLVRQQGEDPAGLLPQRFFNSYTKAYNNRYAHRRTLFEGRFKAVHVISDYHLRHLCRYIHTNPIKDRIVDNLVDWPFSNYLEWNGLRQGTMVDFEFIGAFFENGRTYREFVDDYLTMHQISRELEYLK